MSKPFKIFLWVVAAIVALLLVAVTVLVLTFDPNDYRDDIERIVQRKTGRELQIEGDLALSVFPWLGVELGRTTLADAPGFGDTPMAKIEGVDVRVKLVPLLFDRKIEVGTVELEGMTLNLARNAQGSSNWDDLVEVLAEDAEQAEQAEPQPEPAGGGIDLSDVGIGSVVVSDASLVYDDRQAQQRYAVHSLNLETGELRFDEPIKLKLDFVFDSEQPQLSAKVDLVGLIGADFAAQYYSLDKLTLNVLATGEAIPGGEQQLELTGSARYDAKAGTMAVSDGRLEVAGITLRLGAEGSGLNGGTPQIRGSLSADSFSPRNVLDTLQIEIPAPRDDSVLQKASLDVSFSSNLSSAALPEIRLQLDDTTVTGHATVKDFDTQAIGFGLKLDRIDVDRYLPPETPEDPAPAGDGPAQDIDAIEIPVELLEQFNATGTLEIGRLQISGLTMQDVRLELSAPRQARKTVALDARLYGGSVSTRTQITPGPTPRYDTDTRLDSIAVGPLLSDYAGEALLTGSGEVSLQLATQGRTVGELRRALDGNAALALVDGAIKGFNIGQAIRRARAALQGEQFSASEPAQTDFAALEASGTITDGVFRTSTVDLKNPLFRLSGEGEVDLVEERIDFLAKPTIVATSTGQGGKELEELSGLTIPVRVEGPLNSPELSLDLADALKARARDRAREELEEHEDEIREKLDEKLGSGAADVLRGLFDRKKKQDDSGDPDSGDGDSKL